jgi:hypothetical protein
MYTQLLFYAQAALLKKWHKMKRAHGKNGIRHQKYVIS